MSILGIIQVLVQSEYGKMRTRVTPNTDTFHAVVTVHLDPCFFGKWWAFFWMIIGINFEDNPAGNYKFTFNKRNTTITCEICSKSTIKTPGPHWLERQRHHWLRSGAFIVNFEHITHLVLAFLILTFSR